ncbi:hypothetical protein PT309_03650, partial [Metamycoplasma hyosynoviae]|nr:hypothetical protein [Metamycoplasma hyosynoviae]
FLLRIRRQTRTKQGVLSAASDVDKGQDIKLVKIRESCMYSNANLSFPLWWNVFEYVKNFSYFFNNKFFSNKDILTPILELDPNLNLIYTFLLLLIISITIPLIIFRSIKGEI